MARSVLSKSALVLSLLITLLPGCESAQLYEESDITGVIPYILSGGDFRYAPRTEDYGEGNILKIEY